VYQNKQLKPPLESTLDEKQGDGGGGDELSLSQIPDEVPNLVGFACPDPVGASEGSDLVGKDLPS
jgi:hypothetical protein